MYFGYELNENILATIFVSLNHIEMHKSEDYTRKYGSPVNTHIGQMSVVMVTKVK